ncbi:MAG TPA: hypothetical protein VHR72_09075 [Gemmataceae bacterium]|nr:hypothetical protein [Gemmataceae bacterium]
MRPRNLTAVCIALAICTTCARAQSNTLGYVGAPVTITNVPIDTSKAIGMNTNAGQSLLGATSNSLLNTGLNFQNFFKTSRFSLPSFPGTAPTSTVLPQTQNLFQPTVPTGKSPLTGGTVVSNTGQSLLGTATLGNR